MLEVLSVVFPLCKVNIVLHVNNSFLSFKLILSLHLLVCFKVGHGCHSYSMVSNLCILDNVKSGSLFGV